MHPQQATSSPAAHVHDKKGISKRGHGVWGTDAFRIGMVGSVVLLLPVVVVATHLSSHLRLADSRITAGISTKCSAGFCPDPTT